MAMTRSQQMARMKGKDTKPEKLLRSMLWARGLRYRVHARTPVGRPDIVFPGVRCAVFIDGCFWHGCPTHYVMPRTRHEFWAKKLADNVQRDRRQTLKLESEGWVVLRFWEHEVEDDLAGVCAAVEGAVRAGAPATGDQWRVWRVEPVAGAGNEERRHLVQLRDSSTRFVDEGPRYSRAGPVYRGTLRLKQAASRRGEPAPVRRSLGGS